MAAITGTTGDDTLNGTSGADTIDGLGGNDVINGGSGIDTVHGGDGDDAITDGNGQDAVYGDGGNDSFTITASKSGGTLFGGDGADLVTYRQTGAFTVHYHMDLGAGDDHLDVYRLDSYGGAAYLTLGAGQDTITLHSSIKQQSPAFLDISDFTPGAGGDSIDILEYLKACLGTSLPDGVNPFETTYLKLEQVGNDVLLSAIINASTSSFYPLAYFRNTTLADFTGDNFGGLNPFPPLNKTLEIADQDYALAAGDTVSIHDGYGTAALHYLVHDQTLTGETFSAVNHGTILAEITEPGDILGVRLESYANETAPSVRQTVFLNAADGIIEADNTGNSPDVGNSHVQTTGILADLTGDQLRNDGQVIVNADFGVAEGVIINEADFQIQPDTLRETAGNVFVNNGSIDVNTSYFAIGVQAPGDRPLLNAGMVNVHGDEFAIGFRLNANRLFAEGRFVNRGVIQVTADPHAGSYSSIGVYLLANIGSAAEQGAVTFVNSGTISAEAAIYAAEGIGYPDGGESQAVINSAGGQIYGDVILGLGQDVVQNDGFMSSFIDLGGGDDRYDGVAGTLSGGVFGGMGDDVLVGGTGGEILYGESGNDSIAGGGGNDVVDGGSGYDYLSGGAGYDTLSYYDSSSGVIVDLVAGTTVEGLSQDKILGFEKVVGSAFADVVTGSSVANEILGMKGDDVINGGGGADVLNGGPGHDVLSGGAGVDRFLFQAGDGNDEITDFVKGEAIEIYGYSASAAALSQQGADVLITLGEGDSLLVRNALAATVSSALYFIGTPLDLGFTDTTHPLAGEGVSGPSVVTDEDLIVPAGKSLTLIDPYFENDFTFGAGFSDRYDDLAHNHTLYNAGTLGLRAGNYLSLVLAVDFLHVVNAAGATISLDTSGDGAGTFQADSVFNSGTVEVTSVYGQATGILDTDYVYEPTEAFHHDAVVNAGTIHVSSTHGSAVGVGHLNSTTAGVTHLWNSGSIEVSGAAASQGLDLIGTTQYSTDAPFVVVNSGSIAVTDGTAAIDSAGILIETDGGWQIFNSGTISGDYAICRNNLFQGGNFASDAHAEIYNSGTLNGRVDLSRDNNAPNSVNFTLVNTGQINGNVTLWEGNDLFDSRNGVFTASVFGGSGNDRLLTGSGHQVLGGGAGNDTLSGGFGNDTLTGGAGADVFRYEKLFGIDTITDFNGAEGDRIQVRYYTAWQSIDQVGSDVVVTFEAGNELIFQNRTLAEMTPDMFVFGAAAIAATPVPAAPAAPAAPDIPAPPPAPVVTPPTIGSNASQTINGTLGNDVLVGHAGDDVINGKGGSDLMLGGTGNDIYYIDLPLTIGTAYDAHGDVVVEAPNQGIDEIRASVDYALPDNVENLRLSGSAVFGAGNALANHIYAVSLAATLRGYGGADVIDGSGHDDQIYGGTGTDTLNGLLGNDTIWGEAGNDVLTGGTGADFLSGGAGADTFVFSAITDSPKARQDTIEDFTHSQHDHIDLSAIDAIAGGSDDPFTLVAALSGAAGQLAIQTVGPNHYLVVGDTNGDGIADIAINVDSLTALNAADFVL